MQKLRSSLSWLVVFASLSGVAQNIRLKGVVSDADGYPIEGVVLKAGSFQTETNSKGMYELQLPADAKVDSLEVSHPNFQPIKVALNLTDKKQFKNFALAPAGEMGEKLDPVVVFQKERKPLMSVEINPKLVSSLPSLTGGIEDLIKSQIGVNSNTELSSQYMVRGGNYDENLTYINGVEIYRPFLVRNAQQEGLSIINPDLVSLINFSAGGFEAKYGDRMSSILDITYKKPRSFEAAIEASMIGGRAYVGLADKSQKLSSVLGIRYRNTNLILNTLEGDTDFNPVFYDIQSFTSYSFHPKLSISFLGAYAVNEFQMIPRTRQTEFGTVFRPIRLTVAYRGQENDKYTTLNSVLSLQYKPSKKWNFSWDNFAYQGQEQEYFTIASGYILQDLDPATGAVISAFDGGGQIDHARNDLDALVLGSQVRGSFKPNANTVWEFGSTFQRENFRDFMHEWQLIDSTGYNVPRPPDFDGNLELNFLIRSRANITNTRWMNYVQFSKKFLWNTTKVFFNAGVRHQYWSFSGEQLISPRVQIALKPDWKKDMLFRFATGVYYQPPFYKEIRRLDGSINPDIESQRSIHFILGNDYEFPLFNRNFKLTTEVYYKHMDNLIPYYVDNVRVKYTGDNNSVGRAYGIDMRLNGEFIEGAESWLTLSYARAEENIDDRGWLPRPTDQRFRAALFFQDYMPQFPSFKANVNLVYSSGLPNGAPLFTDPYQYQSYLPDYIRVDVGLMKVFVDEKDFKSNHPFWGKFKEFVVGLEIFNLFDVQNVISNQWIRDVNSGVSYAVPNRLTGRFLNLKLLMRF